MSHLEVFGAYGHFVLIVFLILVEREVLVDVFHVGSGLVRRVIAFGSRIGVGRVALRVVDAFVSLQDGSLYLVVV